MRTLVLDTFDHQTGTYVVIDRKSLCTNVYVRTYVNSKMNGTWMFQNIFRVIKYPKVVL